MGGTEPTEYAERGWGRFDVEVVGKPGKYTYQGKPETCSRNFYLSGQFKCDNKGKLKPLGDITYEKINPDKITADELNYFLREMDGPPDGIDGIFDLLPMPVSEFKQLPQFSLFETACSYFRVEFEIPLRIALENQKRIKKLSGENLRVAHAMLSTYPWKLCFDKYAGPLGLKEMTYKGFHTYRIKYKKKVNPLFLQAIRLYSFMRDQDHELFHVGTLFESYLRDPVWGPIAYENNDKDMRPAFDFLMFQGLCNANYKDDAPLEYVAFNKRVWINGQAMEAVRDMLRRPLPSKGPSGTYVPCRPSNTLSATQARVVGHALANRLTFCEGAPGTGKTEVLVAIMAELSKRESVSDNPRGPLVVTYVGMMVDALQRRFGKREETANTIHYVCHKVETNSEEAMRWIHQFNVLIIDEGSNVDVRLFGRLLRCLPNLTHLVMVGDLGQIYPIKKGCPFYDLTRTFPQHSFMLDENKRVDPDSLQLAQAAALIRRGESHLISFNVSPCLSMVDRREEELLERILETYVQTAQDTMNMQFVVLRNLERTRLNARIEEILLQRKVLKKPAFRCYSAGGCLIYPGKKITFHKNNKEAGVRNGEMGQVRTINVDTGTLTLTNGKTLKFGQAEGCVDPTTVGNGYATTCNKAQGSEWDNVVFWMYENPSRFFTREFAYVAISRAKKRCIVVGTQEEFNFLCAERAKERNTLLRYYLYLEGLAESATAVPPGPLTDPKTFKLLPPDALAIPVEKKDNKKQRTLP